MGGTRREEESRALTAAAGGEHCSRQGAGLGPRNAQNSKTKIAATLFFIMY